MRYRDMPRVAIWTVFIVVLLLLSITATYLIYPAWLGLEREAIEQSNQYHQSRMNEMRVYYDAYLKNEVTIASLDSETNSPTIEALQNQNAASLIQIYRIVDELGNNVPDYIYPFLQQHPYPKQ